MADILALKGTPNKSGKISWAYTGGVGLRSLRGECWIPVPLPPPLPLPHVFSGWTKRPSILAAFDSWDLDSPLSGRFSPCVARYVCVSTQDCKGRPRHGPRPVVLHDVKQPASRRGSAQPVSFPRRVCASGCCFLFFLSPPHLRCLCRRSGGLAPEILASAADPTPNRGAGGAPGGALPNVSRSYGATSRLRGVSRPAQPGRRLSALHRGVVGPGPAPSPALPPDPARRLLVGQAVVPGCGPGRLVSAGYEPRSTPLPAPPSGSSPEDAPHERGCESIARIRHVVNTEVTT